LQESVQQIYIIAPEANAAVMKKLRGLGVAFGVSVEPFLNISELPERPNPNSILLIPEHVVDRKFPKDSWQNIFLIGRGRRAKLRNQTGLILLNCDEDTTIDWAAVTEMAIKFILKPDHCTPWYAIRTEVDLTSSTSAQEFSAWCKRQKSPPFSTFARLQKNLENLDKMTSGKNLKGSYLAISVDSTFLQLKLRLQTSEPLDPELVVEQFPSQNTPLTSVHQGPGIFEIRYFVNLTSSQSSRLSILILNPYRAITKLKVSREAS